MDNFEQDLYIVLKPQTIHICVGKDMIPLPLSQSLFITHFLISLPQTTTFDIFFFINVIISECLIYDLFFSEV